MLSRVLSFINAWKPNGFSPRRCLFQGMPWPETNSDWKTRTSCKSSANGPIKFMLDNSNDMSNPTLQRSSHWIAHKSTFWRIPIIVPFPFLPMTCHHYSTPLTSDNDAGYPSLDHIDGPQASITLYSLSKRSFFQRLKGKLPKNQECSFLSIDINFLKPVFPVSDNLRKSPPWTHGSEGQLPRKASWTGGVVECRSSHLLSMFHLNVALSITSVQILQ